MAQAAGDMMIQYSPGFIKKLRKLHVRIRKSFKEKIQIFEKNPYDLQLENHTLEREYEGLRSINLTSDYRAIYEEINEGEEVVVYFLLLGTHKELYG